MRSDLPSHFLPRSDPKVPRSGLKVPRLVPVLPRSPVELPRSCRDLPRCRSDLPRSLLSNDPTADASPRFSNRDPPRPPDQPTHRPTNLAPRSTTTFRGVSRSPISAVVDDDVPRSVAVGFCSAAKCRDAWFRAPRFRVVFIPVAPRSAAPPHPRFAWARTVYPRFA